MNYINSYIAVDGSTGSFRNYSNTAGGQAFSLTRCLSCILRLRLFSSNSNSSPLPLSAFDGVVSWSFVIDYDFDHSTSPVLMGDSASIEAGSVIDAIEGRQCAFTQVSIPMTDMNTAELSKLLGNDESSIMLFAELTGYDGDGARKFVLRMPGITVRNLLYETGNPTFLPESYLNADQVRALVASGVVLQFSEDGDDWHDTQTAQDRFLRFRSASSESASWSQPINVPYVNMGGSWGDITGDISDQADLQEALDAKRDKNDLGVYEPENQHWTWTSDDPALPEDFLELANAYGAPKPQLTPDEGGGYNWGGVVFYNADGSIRYICEVVHGGQPSDTSIEFFFELATPGVAAFAAVASRTSATGTDPVPIQDTRLATLADLHNAMDYAVRSVLPLITAIPASTSSYTLLAQDATTNNHSNIYAHSPEAAPTYTLPAVTATTVSHVIFLEVDMTNTASVVFQDSGGTAITPSLAGGTPAVGDVWQFMCEYSTVQSKWLVLGYKED